MGVVRLVMGMQLVVSAAAAAARGVVLQQQQRAQALRHHLRHQRQWAQVLQTARALLATLLLRQQ